MLLVYTRKKGKECHPVTSASQQFPSFVIDITGILIAIRDISRTLVHSNKCLCFSIHAFLCVFFASVYIYTHPPTDFDGSEQLQTQWRAQNRRNRRSNTERMFALDNGNRKRAASLFGAPNIYLFGYRVRL